MYLISVDLRTYSGGLFHKSDTRVPDALLLFENYRRHDISFVHMSNMPSAWTRPGNALCLDSLVVVDCSVPEGTACSVHRATA
jgi:hypothetical protein